MHSWNILSINFLGIFSLISSGNSRSNFPSIFLSICPGIYPAIFLGIHSADRGANRLFTCLRAFLAVYCSNG